MSIKFGTASIVTDNLSYLLDANEYPGSGTTWGEATGNGNNGTLNGPTYNGGNQGYFDFDGSNDYVDLTTTPSGANPTFTFSFWVNFDNYSGYQRLVSGGTADSGGQRFFIGYNSTSDTIDCGIGSATITPSTDIKPTAGDWFNLVVTNLTTNTKFYLNGSLVSSNTHSNGASTSASSPKLCKQYGSNSEYFNGKMAVASYYTARLTDAQILSNYNALKGRFGL